MQNNVKSWAVENFQIPVPIGDCSVHILLDLDKKLIDKAFIMDGGTVGDSLKAEDAIKDHLEIIDKELSEFLGIKTKLAFDAWVVTHWDEDHYMGVLNLLKCPDFEARFKKGAALYSGHEPVEKAKDILNEAKIFSKVKHGEENLGLDLFTGEHIFLENLKDHKYDKSGRPVFCVHAADGTSIGHKNDKKNLKRNPRSIISVLSWPSHEGRCSYFTAGDGNPELELDFVIPNMEKKNTIAWLDGEYGMFLMKLDHHGSSAETFRTNGKKDRAILEKLPLVRLKPQCVLVTPGDRHGHPTYDVLYLLERALKYHKWGKNNDGNASKAVGRVFATRAPYWVTKELPDKKDVNIDHEQNIQGIQADNHEPLDIQEDEHLDVATMIAQDSMTTIQDHKIFVLLDDWAMRIADQFQIEWDFEGEPGTNDPRSTWLDYLDLTLGYRRNLQFAGKEALGLTSEQPLSDFESTFDVKTDYYLVRFTFVDGKPQQITWTTDGMQWSPHRTKLGDKEQMVNDDALRNWNVLKDLHGKDGPKETESESEEADPIAVHRSPSKDKSDNLFEALRSLGENGKEEQEIIEEIEAWKPGPEAKPDVPNTKTLSSRLHEMQAVSQAWAKARKEDTMSHEEKDELVSRTFVISKRFRLLDFFEQSEAKDFKVEKAEEKLERKFRLAIVKAIVRPERESKDQKVTRKRKAKMRE